MAKQIRAEITREAILRASAKLFDRHGYRGASLNDVLKLAGVTKGALYFHFSSKEELARAVISYQHLWAVGVANEELEEGQTGLEAVIRLSQSLALQLMHDPMVRAGIRLTLEHGTFGESTSEPYEGWIAVTERLLVHASESGELDGAVRPAVVARFVVGAFTGVQILSQVMTGRNDLWERIREMWEMLLPTLVPERKLPHYRQFVRMGATGEVKTPTPRRPEQLEP
ncbi:ScbR family autoregulator-binding transcription factor [Amycolatopsis anabasis]|uniref:ScbR family autoregulator-binding transcription factor n=1 Tax=Amycolatopsis anabasis TaxID=1840409 RepID=UPI00131B2121|nr:ScbR family autoregulator-binding transcription factor [Amycolatopsis anabasis]